ncbi:hypothetical protein FRC06_010275 [Ceratobasidium sp. 370]|nr:hypothetical protein FRC06_010275 [Ceratobasidium sp. 370]
MLFFAAVPSPTPNDMAHCKGKKNAPTHNSDNDEDDHQYDSHKKEACVIKAVLSKPAEEKKKDNEDNEGDEDNKDGKIDDEEDDQRVLAAENTKLYKTNKKLMDELRTICGMCNQAGLLELMNADATPSASGSGSHAAAAADNVLVIDLADVDDGGAPINKVPVPSNKGDVKASDIHKMAGLGGRNSASPWLEMCRDIHNMIVQLKLDISVPWKGQDKTCLVLLYTSVCRRNPELARFAKNWAAEYLVQEVFGHCPSHWLAMQQDETTSSSSDSSDNDSGGNAKERKGKRKEKEWKWKERRKERKKEEKERAKEDRARAKEKAKVAKEKERKECEHEKERREHKNKEREKEREHEEERKHEEREHKEKE